MEAGIRSALAGGKALELVGRGSKRGIGRAAQWDASSIFRAVRRHAL